MVWQKRKYGSYQNFRFLLLWITVNILLGIDYTRWWQTSALISHYGLLHLCQNCAKTVLHQLIMWCFRMNVFLAYSKD